MVVVLVLELLLLVVVVAVVVMMMTVMMAMMVLVLVLKMLMLVLEFLLFVVVVMTVVLVSVVVVQSLLGTILARCTHSAFLCHRVFDLVVGSKELVVLSWWSRIKIRIALSAPNMLVKRHSKDAPS